MSVMESQAAMAAENPFGFGYLLNTIYMYLQKPLEITILNLKNHEITKYLSEMFLPQSILVSIKNKDQIKNLTTIPFFKGKEFNNEKTIVFVCKDFTCSLPLESITEIEKQL
jgi:hypothetical protein